MDNKILGIIFLALLALYLLTRVFSRQPEKTFRSELVQVDTALVDKIELYPKAEAGQTVTLERNGGQWVVTDGNITAPAISNAVASVLGQLHLMKAKRVVAKKEEKWKDYEVDEGSGARVKAYVGGEAVADFMVGRFNFNQQARTALSYVRLTEEEEVYAVDGFLSMTFGQDIDAFRNKQILKLDNGEEVSALQLQTNGNAINFQKDGTTWTYNGTALDSTKIAGYLSGLRYVAGNTFADGFSPVGTPEQSLLVQTGTKQITVNAYRYAAGEQDFAIQSSQYPEAYFASDSSGIYSRLFGDLTKLTGEMIGNR